MRKYEYSARAIILRRYRDMRARVEGRGIHKDGPWQGLDIMSKAHFVEWALLDKSFNDVYSNWEQCAFNPSQVPSIHRIDSNKGYIRDNMEWLPVKSHRQLTLRKRGAQI
jgi:hypothetical protein